MAQTWLDTALNGRAIPSLLIAVGFGDGSLLRELEERAPSTRVLVLDPDARNSKALATNAALRQWRDSGRLAYFAAPDYTGAEDAWRIFKPADEPTVVVHPAVARSTGLGQAKELLKKILFGVKANAEARRKFAPRYLLNSLRNVPSIVSGHDVGVLADAYRGVPAVIAAAGPSLDRVICELHTAQDRALLIACDTALRPLLHSGLKPQLVVGADPGVINARHFQSLPCCPDTWLIAESALDPSAVAPFADRTLWFRVANHHPWPWLNEIGIGVGLLEMWGSVLTAAFQVACLAGCDPIVIVGADLSYPDGRPYARGTTYEFDWAHAVARGSTLAEAWQTQIARPDLLEIPDLRGVPTVTTPILLSFRDWMLARIKASGRRVINATGAGMLFGDGVEQGTLDAALADGRNVQPVASVVAEPRPFDREEIRRAVQQVARTATNESARPVADWIAFTQGGLEITDVSRALDDTAAALGAAIRADARNAIANVRFATESTSPLLTQVPELVERLRIGLHGGALSTVDVTDRGALLIQALELLAAISAHLLDGEDLASGADAALIGKQPATALYPWPDTTRWAVAVFEAMLAATGHAPASAPPCGFWSGAVSPRDESRDAAVSGLHSATHPHATHACIVLLTEWLRCAATLPELGAELREAVERLCAIEVALRNTAAIPGCTGDSAVTLTAGTGAHIAQLDVALPFTGAMLARALTGASATDDASFETCAGRAVAVSVRITPSGTWRRSIETPARRLRTIRPRVLTDEGVPRAGIAYAIEKGAVCLPLYGTETFVLRDGLDITPHHRWPYPIVGELPLGTDGAVAWGNGVGGSEVRPGYVMYRHHAEAEPTFVSLPFRPSSGVWWRERLYWTCLASGLGAWTGIASWAPGEEPRFELPDLALWGMHPETERLRLEPRALTADEQSVRQIQRRGFSWPGPGRLAPVTLGPYGSASSHATHGQWTATVYPDADLVRVHGSDGRSLDLRCYFPMRAVWLGDSLLVHVVGRELLLFADILTQVDR